MGASSRAGVVNRDLEVFAVPNLSVDSTSVFPSGPTANPTMMLMAFCLRLAEHLAARYGGAGRSLHRKSESVLQ
jgi:choline dehydrogenase-like flavoprotein